MKQIIKYLGIVPLGLLITANPSYGIGLILSPSGDVPTSVGKTVKFDAIIDARNSTDNISSVQFDVSYVELSRL